MLNFSSNFINRRDLVTSTASRYHGRPISLPRGKLLLSYRHGYHAGNHADVLKHLVVSLLLDKLVSKPTPCVYIDTHAGAGAYDLSRGWSQKTAEFKDGIERLLDRKNLPPLIDLYLSQVRALRQSQPKGYPGSPVLAQQMLREQDKLILMELHNKEIDALRKQCGRDRRVSVHHRDGFEGLPAIVPPPLPRGLALVDPSYEVAGDYRHTADSVARAAKRWTTGMFAVWYPLLGGDKAGHAARLLQQLKTRTEQSVLIVELQVSQQAEDFGMHGSGMAIINPPWQLDTQLQEVMPVMTQVLAQDEAANWRVEWLREQV